MHFTIIMFAFIILLLLNIFFVYIPINRIENALSDIDDEVKEITLVVKPVITKLTPLFESII